MKTDHGEFILDDAGLYHYTHTSMGEVRIAVRDALKHRPEGAAWFWFNDTFTPIQPDDDEAALLNRWEEWRRSCQRGNPPLPTLITRYCKQAV